MALKEKFLQAKENYRITVENWNTAIERNVSLPDVGWDNLLKDMEKAAEEVKAAWREYRDKELLA